jgi:acyl carrier protein
VPNHANNTVLDSLVRATVAQVCEMGDAHIEASARLEDLQIDSLRMVAIASQVEREFAVQFRPEDLLDFFLAERVEDLIRLISARVE